MVKPLYCMWGIFIMIGIYKITSPSKKIYIGQSIDIKSRFSGYKRLECKKQTILYRSFKKHGVDNHKFEVLCECNIEELNEKERYYQDLYSATGYNGLNCRLTKSSDKSGENRPESKKRISESKKGVTPWNKGKKGLYKTSEETKKKISDSTKGEKNHMFGKKLSEHVKSKITRLGYKHSEESKIKISRGVKGKLLGVPKSEEHKAKTILNIKQTPERIQKRINTMKLKKTK